MGELNVSSGISQECRQPLEFLLMNRLWSDESSLLRAVMWMKEMGGKNAGRLAEPPRNCKHEERVSFRMCPKVQGAVPVL